MGKIKSFFSDEPEKELAGRRSLSQRTRLGQVFTPYAIAKCMALWVSARKSPVSVLDPALGLGIFLRCLLEDEKNAGSELTGYEVDAETAQAAQQLFTLNGYTQIDIRNTNFLTANWDEKFDAILCNPPYRKFRGLADKDEMVAAVRTAYRYQDQPGSQSVYLFPDQVDLAAGRGRSSSSDPAF